MKVVVGSGQKAQVIERGRTAGPGSQMSSDGFTFRREVEFHFTLQTSIGFMANKQRHIVRLSGAFVGDFIGALKGLHGVVLSVVCQQCVAQIELVPTVSRWIHAGQYRPEPDPLTKPLVVVLKIKGVNLEQKA